MTANSIPGHSEPSTPYSYGSLLTETPCSGEDSDLKDEDLGQEVELNEVYKNIGLGPAQYWAWAAVGLMGFSDYAELTVLSVIMPALRCEWGLSPEFEAAIAVTMYGAYAAAAILFGKVADVHGRKLVVSISMVILLLATIGSVAAQDKGFFLFCRLVAGACIGINWTTDMCYATEFAESKLRTIGVSIANLASLSSMFVVGAVALALLNVVGWRWFVVIISIPLIPTLVILIWLPDSPRYLCVSGKKDKALQALQFMARLNGTTLPENLRLECYEDEPLGNCTTLLTKEYIRSTIFLSLIFTCNVFVGFGLVVYLPLMFRTDYCGVNKEPPVHESCALLTQTDLLQMTIGTLLCLIAVVGATFAANLIGRLSPLRIASGLQIIAVSLLFVCMDDIAKVVVAAFCGTLNVIVSFMLWIIVSECYPTNSRSSAIGFINGLARIGGVLGSGSVYLWLYTRPSAILGLFISTSIMGFLATFGLNQETRDITMRDT